MNSVRLSEVFEIKGKYKVISIILLNQIHTQNCQRFGDFVKWAQDYASLQYTTHWANLILC